MERSELVSSPGWVVLEGALREYGAQLVQDLREAKTWDQHMAVTGALSAVDEMLALPNKLFSSEAAPVISMDKPKTNGHIDPPIRPFHHIRSRE